MALAYLSVRYARRAMLISTSLAAFCVATQSNAQAQPGTSASPDSAAAVPAGAEPVGLAEQAQGTSGDSGPDIVVRGVRAAQRAAVDIKRNSAEIIDSIVAEDIGKLPDTTIADSLQRIPGIQITRSAGEGSSVNIRGLGQVLTTLNGERFIGGSNIDGAQPNFTDIPPTLFSGVDVYKSPAAKLLEGGVSGIIDLKTRRPFDLHKGFTATGSADNTYGSRSKDWSGSASGLLGYHGDRWGLLVAGSYSDEKLANISNNTGNSWLAVTDQFAGRDLRGDGVVGTKNASEAMSPNTGYFGTGNYAYQPAVVSLTNQTTERQRLGVNASGQFRISDSLTLTGDAAYTRLDQHDRDVAVQLNSGYAALQLFPGSQIDRNGVVGVGHFQLPQFVVHSDSVPSRSEALNTNLQLDFNNGGRFKGSVRWVHANAKRDSQSSDADGKATLGSMITRGTTAACQNAPTAAPAGCMTYANPGGLPFVDVTADYRGKNPALAFGTDVTNPANYTLQSTWGFGDHRKNDFDAYRADGSYEVGGLIKSIDFGGRYAVQNIVVENYKYLSPVNVPGLGLLNQPGDLYYFKDPQIGHTGRPSIDGRSVLTMYPFSSIPQYVGSYNNFAVAGIPAGGVPGVSPYAMDDPLAFQNALFPGNAAYVDPTTSFRVREKRIELYAQANFGGDLGLSFSGNVGLRAVRTTRDVFSNTTDPNQFIGTGGSYNGVSINQGVTDTRKEFWRYLPSGNLNIDTFKDQKLRLSFAKVVGELDLYALGAGQVLYYGANNGRYKGLPDDLQVFLQGNSGNPNLEPYQSTNYNASYEWYFGHGGLLSVAAFLFDVKSFPQAINTIEPIADQDGVVRSGGVISTTGNGTGGKIKGLEVGYQQNFDFLPGVLSGLGLQANYTYSDSSSSNVDLFGKQLPVPDNSKHQYNVVGIYQKGPVQARVAYNWRSARYVGLQPVNGTSHLYPGDTMPTSDNLAIFSEPVGYLDASASYDVTPRFTLFVQGTNLTKSSDREYAQFKNQFYAQSLFDSRFTFGVRIRN